MSVNLLKMGRMPVRYLTVSDNRKWLVIERNCFETRERESKVEFKIEFKIGFPFLSSLTMNLKINSQHSSGKSEETICCDDFVEELLFLFLFIVDVCEIRV
jgi:hypothetical protein